MTPGRFDCSVHDLKRWNHLSSDMIHPGQFLNVDCRAIDLIPIDRGELKAEELPVAIADVETEISQVSFDSESRLFRAKSPVSYYILNRRESLVSVAERYPGVEPEDIIRLNNLGPHNKPREGMVLKIASY
jgi:hypothetical protein